MGKHHEDMKFTKEVERDIFTTECSENTDRRNWIDVVVDPRTLPACVQVMNPLDGRLGDQFVAAFEDRHRRGARGAPE